MGKAMDHAFLFQRRGIQYVRTPDWLEWDGEMFHVAWAWDDSPSLSDDDLPGGLPTIDADGYFDDIDALDAFLLEHSVEGDGSPCAIETWTDERVFATREEADLWGQSRNRSYPKGWRIRPVTAHGMLREALGTITEQESE